MVFGYLNLLGYLCNFRAFHFYQADNSIIFIIFRIKNKSITTFIIFLQVKAACYLAFISRLI